MPRVATRPKRQTTSAIMLKSTEAWREWFDGFAETTRLPKQVMIDMALQDFAEKHGFTRPPARLAPRG